MSVIVKGMEMPKSCLHCFCMRGCPAARRRQNEAEPMFPRTYRHDDCPLVEVPPHGRLGDLDALKKKALIRSERRGRFVNVADMVISAYDIETAPTIIPAEEE